MVMLIGLGLVFAGKLMFLIKIAAAFLKIYP